MYAAILQKRMVMRQDDDDDYDNDCCTFFSHARLHGHLAIPRTCMRDFIVRQPEEHKNQYSIEIGKRHSNSF